MESFNYYLVKMKGFKDQYSNEQAAKRKFGQLKRAFLNNEEAGKVELFGKNKIEDSWIILDQFEVSEEYFS